MASVYRHIVQSLSWKLSLGILLMAIPIFLLSIGILFSQSRDKVKKEATMHAASVVNTTMQHFTRFMEIVETATDVNDWEVTENLNPDSLLAYSRNIVILNGHIDGCSISSEMCIRDSEYVPQIRQALLCLHRQRGGQGHHGCRRTLRVFREGMVQDAPSARQALLGGLFRRE